MDLSRYIAIKNAYRRESEKKAEERRNAFFESNPKMRELSDEMISAQLELSLLTIRDIDTGKAEHRVSALLKKWRSELRKHGLREEDFEPSYHCNLCKDSGFIGMDPCSCLKKWMAEDFREEYELSHMLETQNFEVFQLDIFSDEASVEIKNRHISQRALMELNLKKARDFVASFPSGESLLFIGGTGLGKTFLANCIADAVISKGHPVSYHRYIGLEMLLNEQMSFVRNEESAERYKLLNDAELLIIDDLAPARFESLAASVFEIIDTRQANNRSTLITTNLTPSEISAHFGERFHSRLQRYTTFTFLGKDVRSRDKR